MLVESGCYLLHGSFIRPTQSSKKLHDGAANNICLLDRNEIFLNGKETFVTFPIDGANEYLSACGLPSRVPKPGSSRFFFFFFFFVFCFLGFLAPFI